MKKIFLDCTTTHCVPLTGIGRVITKIIAHRDVIREFGNYEIVLFAYKNGSLQEIGFEDFSAQSNKRQSLSFKLREYGANKLFQFFSYINSDFLSKLLELVIQHRLTDKTIGGSKQVLNKNIQFTPGLDILLLGEFPGDFTPNLIAFAKKNKLNVVAIVYDLIPTSHPELSGHFVESFNTALNDLLSISTVNIAISEFTKDCLETYLEFLKMSGKRLPPSKCFHFNLGSDLTAIDERYSTSKFKDVFSESTPAFLICGTIEPRKNHMTVVKAFERRWAKNSTAKLLIIGRKGWDIATVLDYITGHPEYGKRLFWFNDVDDKELAFAYRHSRALIFASFIEGFGLPLVEAEFHGIPVLCSDIPVFHEVIGDRATYFNPYDPDDISLKIESFLSSPEKISTTKPVIMTWEQSVRQLFSIITREIEAA